MSTDLACLLLTGTKTLVNQVERKTTILQPGDFPNLIKSPGGTPHPKLWCVHPLPENQSIECNLLLESLDLQHFWQVS